MKTCKQCGEVKPLDEFHKSKSTRDGYRGDCKACHNATSRQWRAAHPERMAALNKQWKQDHPEEVAANNKQWRQEHPEAVSAYTKEYQAKNPLKKRAQNIINRAIRDGKLTKPTTCSECNATGTIQGHHCDYTKPLEVMWLCQTCHIAWHKEHGTDLNGEAA
jgi:hypothetical protein